MIEDDRIYHIRMHQPRGTWTFLVLIIGSLFALFLYLDYVVMQAESDPYVPYSIDLRSNPGHVSYDGDYITVAVENSDGTEVRQYFRRTGVYRGSVLLPAETGADEVQ